MINPKVVNGGWIVDCVVNMDSYDLYCNLFNMFCLAVVDKIELWCYFPLVIWRVMVEWTSYLFSLITDATENSLVLFCDEWAAVKMAACECTVYLLIHNCSSWYCSFLYFRFIFIVITIYYYYVFIIYHYIKIIYIWTYFVCWTSIQVGEVFVVV